jgi:hypothetical protein
MSERMNEAQMWLLGWLREEEELLPDWEHRTIPIGTYWYG